MYDSQIYQLAYQGLLLILILSGPPIIISMLFGLTVAILQAATQVQEQTLSFTIKLIAVIATLMLLGGFLSAQIMEYTHNIFTNFHRWTD